jgi:hypothetical protein
MCGESMTRTTSALMARQFRLPRQGHALSECQDAVAGDPLRGRFAVADGASESSFAGWWAQMLVEDFVRSPLEEPAWETWLPPLQQRWARAVGPNGPEETLPWYLEPGLQVGAFATFLGLVLQPTSQPGPAPWRWYALAVGDSCLFQVRNDAVIRAFPVTHSAEFGNTPWLVGSRSSPDEVPRKQGQVLQGDGQGQDRLWLMTDALAQWFLHRFEAGHKPWEDLDYLLQTQQPDRAFADWISDLRQDRQLRNDDVTLLGVCLEE